MDCQRRGDIIDKDEKDFIYLSGLKNKPTLLIVKQQNTVLENLLMCKNYDASYKEGYQAGRDESQREIYARAYGLGFKTAKAEYKKPDSIIKRIFKKLWRSKSKVDPKVEAQVRIAIKNTKIDFTD